MNERHALRLLADWLMSSSCVLFSSRMTWERERMSKVEGMISKELKKSGSSVWKNVNFLNTFVKNLLLYITTAEWNTKLEWKILALYLSFLRSLPMSVMKNQGVPKQISQIKEEILKDTL